MKFLFSNKNNNDIRFKFYDMVRVYKVIYNAKNYKEIVFSHYKLSGKQIETNPYGLHHGTIFIKNGIVTKKGSFLSNGCYINHTLTSEKKWIRHYKMCIFK